MANVPAECLELSGILRASEIFIKECPFLALTLD